MTRIFPITGAFQDEADQTGLHSIRQDILRPLEAMGIDVEPVRPWKEDWEKLATRCALDGVVDVIIIAYSWGAGWAAQRLSRALESFGICVTVQVLIDPVYRPLWIPAWGPANIFGFRALMPGAATIAVPDNVLAVVGVRQDSVLPMGHPIRHHGKTFHLPLIRSSHRNIINHPEARRLVIASIHHLITS